MELRLEEQDLYTPHRCAGTSGNSSEFLRQGGTAKGTTTFFSCQSRQSPATLLQWRLHLQPFMILSRNPKFGIQILYFGSGSSQTEILHYYTVLYILKLLKVVAWQRTSNFLFYLPNLSMSATYKSAQQLGWPNTLECIVLLAQWNMGLWLLGCYIALVFNPDCESNIYLFLTTGYLVLQNAAFIFLIFEKFALWCIFPPSFDWNLLPKMPGCPPSWVSYSSFWIFQSGVCISLQAFHPIFIFIIKPRPNHGLVLQQSCSDL